MNIYSEIREIVIQIIGELVKNGDLPEGLSLKAITAEPPRDATHGDIATNAAMVIAKPAKTNPRAIAEKISAKLQENELVAKVDIAGPGFINIKLHDKIWYDVLQKIIKLDIKFGKNNLGQGEKTNVEFVSANPTGPLHIGHARGAIFGDILANLMVKSGYDVTREYYINDAGSQIDILVKSLHHRYLEALGDNVGEVPEGCYPGSYLIPVAEELAKENGEKFRNLDNALTEELKEIAINAMMDLVRDELLQLGVKHDVFVSEKKLHSQGMVEEGVKVLESKGLIYRGTLEPPKGKLPDDWEAREQLLFKSSEFGDDVDRAIQKSDGSWTYFAGDIAYHLDKYNRGYSRMLLELGADHGGYLKRMKAMIAAISDNKATMDIKFHQLVNFLEDGKPAKMSKRAGTFITVSDVLAKVDKDVLRFIMMTRKNDAVLDFDFVKVQEQSKDNPVFYVQYAYARVCSVMRNAKETLPESVELMQSVDIGDLAKLNSDSEIELIKLLASWPRIIESATKYLEPHRIAFYLGDVAAGFHSLWNNGKDDASLRFIIEDDVKLTAARLVLLQSVTVVIASGLNIFGITPIEEMR